MLLNFGEARTRIFIARLGVVMIAMSSGLISAEPIAAREEREIVGDAVRACRCRRGNRSDAVQDTGRERWRTRRPSRGARN